MQIAYGIITLVSLCMLGVCVLTDKKRDVWLLLVFVSVSLCNLGYFMTSISRDLADALNSNRIAYLGSVFLPFFLLMMVLRFCRIRKRRQATVILAAIGVVMLTITTSPGILPIYYSTVDIEIVNGTTKLVREYGPLHKLYYVYLIGYMLSMIGVTLYAISKRKIKSRRHTILLICAVFCNITIWLVEQFLPRGFEWLSISYIITEGLILAIYRSMQRQGLMSAEERAPSYTINVLLSVFLLLFTNFIRVATNETTEVLYIISQLVILAIYIGILVFWAASVYDRIVNKTIRHYLITLVGLMMLWMFMRTLRHTVFFHIFPIGQWCWYTYYISLILIPQISLMAAKCIGKPEEFKMPKSLYLLYIPSGAMILGILTNDLHGLAFEFHMGYEAGWGVYRYGILYYIATVWIFTCVAMMIFEVVRHCRIPRSKRTIWLPIGLLGVAVLYSVLYAVNSNLFGFIEMTAALCFIVVAIWESCIKTGLIQSNGNYNELLKCSKLRVSVVDNTYSVHYRSDDALDLDHELIEKTMRDPVTLDKGIRVSSSRIKGGFTIYQEDISELIDILDELNQLREELRDSNEVSMQNYHMDKRIRALEEKNRLHDELHRQTAKQINLMNDWLRVLSETDDPGKKRELLRRIVVVGAYLKRRNNLALVGEQTEMIKEEELNLSVKEMIKNLQITGVSSAASVQFEKDIPTETAMNLLDFYEYVVESSFDGLTYLLVRFFSRDDSYYCCVDAVCSRDLTELATDIISVSVIDENYYTLSFKVKGGNRI